MLCSSALVSAGVIGTGYAPATSGSYSSSPVFEKSITGPIGYTKIIQSPPPVYQSILTTKESNYETSDGTQHTAYTKSLDTGYSNLQKYESKATKDGDVIANTIPGIYSSYNTAVHSPIVYQPGPPYTLSSPLVHTVHAPALAKSVSIPISYTTHDVPYTKTIVSPSIASYSTPVFDNTKISTSGLSAYSSHTPLIKSNPVKTTITYSEAPLVSHMSFNGLGASYSW